MVWGDPRRASVALVLAELALFEHDVTPGGASQGPSTQAAVKSEQGGGMGEREKERGREREQVVN